MINNLLAAVACQSVCDAIGDKFEFKKNAGAKEVTEYLALGTPIGITDDTQMMYFGMRAMTTMAEKKLSVSQAYKEIQKEYIIWYGTQVGIVTKGVPKCFYRVRAPGMATMQSLGCLSISGVRPPNDKHGCGSVMKLLPFAGSPYMKEIKRLLAIYSAGVTHDGPQNTAAVNLYMDFANEVQEVGRAAIPKLPRRILKAKRISDLGAGFYAEECIDMALWAVAKSDTFEQCLVNAVAHGGDSDSVGAVAGSLWGLMTGEMPSDRLLTRVDEWEELKKQTEKYLTAAKYPSLVGAGG